MKRRRIWILAVITVLLLTGCTGQEMSFENQQTYASQSAKKTNQKGTADDFGLEVHYLNVGQGDCTLIRTKDKTMLIDAGDNSQGTEVQSYLDSQKIEKLDYVIGTHPDADHIGGLDVVIEEFQCKKVLMPDVTSDTQTYHDVEEALEEKNMKAVHPKCGKTYSLGDASFTIIAPVKDYGSETNNWSIGLVLQYGENRFLFTGDADQDAEKDILAEGEDVSADVYKTSHHGSKTGSSEEFLDAVDPEYAVISCGEENKYGHPSAQTLNRCGQEASRFSVQITREPSWHPVTERKLHGTHHRIPAGHREKRRVLRQTGKKIPKRVPRLLLRKRVLLRRRKKHRIPRQVMF